MKRIKGENYVHFITGLFALVLFFAGGVSVNAAYSYQINSSAVNQVDEWGVCKNVRNLNSLDIFVPTFSPNEWSYFRFNAENVSLDECYTFSWYEGSWSEWSDTCGEVTRTRQVYCERNDGTAVEDSLCDSGTRPDDTETTNLGSCCSSNYGQSCTSPANACGQTTSGTYACDGTCSVTTAPANPSYYGQSCTSPANACGQTNSGTYACDGSCSASTPVNPSYYGQSCTSPANACGQTTSGTYTCDGTCSVTTAPANPSYYGQSCTSPANSCGMTNSGTYDCNQVCSATTAPSESLCPIYGCTDPNASNYDPNANTNDFSCVNYDSCTVSGPVAWFEPAPWYMPHPPTCIGGQTTTFEHGQTIYFSANSCYGGFCTGYISYICNNGTASVSEMVCDSESN